MRLRSLVIISILILSCSASWGAAMTFVPSPQDFAGYTFSQARYDAGADGILVDSSVQGESVGGIVRGVVTSPVIECSFPFDTALLSWNALTPKGSYVVCYMQARAGGVWSRWIKQALWTSEASVWKRTTFPKEKDSIAYCNTSQMGLSKKADAIRLRVHLETTDGHTYPTLRFLGIQMSDSRLCREDTAPVQSAWGKDLDVPILSQLSVPHGNVWCSPTSVAMVLRYWGEKLHRSDLSNIGIIEAARGISDASWGGTGNWAFNAAWAGEHAGIRAYAVRLSGIAQIEEWINKSVPVVVSLDYNKLRHREGEPMGHLMVIRGFTAGGKPIFNDPWGDPKQPAKLKKQFERADLEGAWLGDAGSYGTAYIIYPEGWKI